MFKQIELPFLFCDTDSVSLPQTQDHEHALQHAAEDGVMAFPRFKRY